MQLVRKKSLLSVKLITLIFFIFFLQLLLIISTTKAQIISDSETNCIICAQFVPDCGPNEVLVLQTCEKCAHCESIDLTKTSQKEKKDCKICRFHFECTPDQICKEGCCTYKTKKEIKQRKTKKLKMMISEALTPKPQNCKTPCGYKCCKPSEKCIVIDQCKNIKTKCKLPTLRYCSPKEQENLKGKIFID